jgi:hypothetical protein
MNDWWIAEIERRDRFDDALREAEQIRLFRKVRNSERRRAQRGSVHTVHGRLRKLECQVRKALDMIEAWLAIPWGRQEGPGHAYGCD